VESGIIQGGGALQRDSLDNLPTVMLSTEQYNRIVRLLTHDPPVPVKLQFEVKAQYFDDNRDSFNVVGEIPGGAKKGEVVMVGGHLDSWHYGTGATDNAVGAAAAMEAMRILKALDLKMDRTVRIGLWGAEEQGLYGSAAYVKEHFADRATMKTTAEHDKFSAYFNIDNGTGKIRGIYTQGNDMVKPIFEEWLKPFQDLGATTVTVRNTGGTDHQSFDAVGLPGFQFIQDPMDYDSRTHHTNMDVYDRIQRADVLQMAAIEASFVYDAATRAEKLPRKPLPKPQPAGGRGGY
jgi:Zn-dependent M28 family amino/carboxypeptidase